LQLVLLWGNPVVMWSGLFAVLVALFRLFRQQRWPELIVVVAYSSLYGQWAAASIIMSGTYYHYYFPAAMTLGPALAVVFASSRPRRVFGMRASSLLLLAAVVVFAISFPVLAAMPAGSRWIAARFFGAD
jgi:dolichyl-phosphate-mannose-protein mannosyltransferase